ncbi:hypothetical protein [Streptomyces sp. NPDC058623]|uniref:hypothetical protein n=1 Tax=Streptomyces sp. NPDC058623 TaxID=3346563 RepID=UPI003653FC0C
MPTPTPPGAPTPTPLLPEAVRRLGSRCAVVLLVTTVLGTALLGPMDRRLIGMKVNRSLAATPGGLPEGMAGVLNRRSGQCPEGPSTFPCM